MAFEPDKITKQHILDAVSYIEQKDISLNPPTKYYVIINDKKYPPKEVMKYAHQQMNGESIWERGGGEATHKYLEPYGFRIVNKNKDMDNSTREIVEQLLKQYGSFIETEEYDELYKWEAIQNFQDNWNIDSQNFKDMLDSSFQPDNCNLWISGRYYPKKMLIEFADQDPEEVREMFTLLFDEDKELKDRILIFKNKSEKLLDRIGKGEKNHYQDDRAISVYLSFRYPDQYFLYKYTMYKEFCDLTGIEPIPKRGSTENIRNYSEVCTKVLNIIEKYPEIIEKHRKLRKKNYFDDEANHVITQDFIYSSISRDKIKNSITGTLGDATNKKKEYDPPLNQILYGPPGTGKTYHTLNHALSILKNDDSFLNDGNFERKELHDLVNGYKEKNQVRFVTFHPSFTYEDFVEGIKPTLQEDEEEQKDIGYEIKPGIFKQICESASAASDLADKKGKGTAVIPDEVLKSGRFFKISLGDSTNPDDDDIYQYCIDKNLATIGYLWDIDCTDVKRKDEIVDLAINKGYEADEFGIKALERFKLWLNEGDVIFVSDGNLKLRAVGIVQNKNGEGYFYDPDSDIDYNHFRHVEWILTDLQIPVHDVYYARFSQQTIYQMKGHKIKKEYFQLEENSSTDEKRYVLVIDEINRGNVPSTFGELITLIEEDKRAGETEETSVILPYSKKETPFKVPSNLYILGTMNTADRSVEALDIALRRRFEFVSFYPDPNKIQQPEDFDVDLNVLLTTINNRIEYLLDRDHTIGHSYFMELHMSEKPEKELKSIFKNKIIPLLEEYFYGQLHNIGLVLGNDFVLPKFKEGHSNTLFPKNFNPQEAPAERVVYRIKDPTTFSSLQPFINIYAES